MSRRLLEARKKNKEALASGTESAGYYPERFGLLVCYQGIEKFPEVNSHFLDDTIKIFNKIHLGIAVDTPRGLNGPGSEKC